MGSCCSKEFSDLHFTPFTPSRATVMLFCSQKKEKMKRRQGSCHLGLCQAGLLALSSLLGRQFGFRMASGRCQIINLSVHSPQLLIRQGGTCSSFLSEILSYRSSINLAIKDRFQNSHQPWKGLTNHFSATWLS